MRVAIVALLGLCLLNGCAPAQLGLHHPASAQLIVAPASDHPGHRPLNDRQLAALPAWLGARADWSGDSVDIPDHPSIDIQIQGDDGQRSELRVYQRDNGKTVAYLYHGQRIAPLARRLTPEDMAALQAIVNGP